MARAQRARSSSSACSGRSSCRSSSCRPARWATSRPASRACATARWATRSPPPSARPGAAARLQAGQAARLRRHLSAARRGLPGAARRAREAPPQRRLDQLRARDVGRARLRLPLRLPRPAPHGDRAGAPRARVRPRPDRLGAVGRVPRALTNGRGEVAVDNPARCRRSARSRSSEPWVKLSVVSPATYIGAADGAGDEPPRHFVDDGVPRPDAGAAHFELPLAEVIVDFYDQLKSRTQGYASMDYEEIGYRRRPGPPRRARGRRAGRRAVADRPPRRARRRAGRSVDKLRQLIPRQMFEVPVQAAIGSQRHRP
jgi:hypothetical protein